jgi:hypothetical protein
MEREKGCRFLMTGDAWLKLANICEYLLCVLVCILPMGILLIIDVFTYVGVDSVPDKGSMFVRSAGWEEAWEEFGPRMD